MKEITLNIDGKEIKATLSEEEIEKYDEGYKHLERLDAMIVEAARKGDHNLLGKLVLVRDGCHEGDGGKAKK